MKYFNLTAAILPSEFHEKERLLMENLDITQKSYKFWEKCGFGGGVNLGKLKPFHEKTSIWPTKSCPG